MKELFFLLLNLSLLSSNLNAQDNTEYPNGYDELDMNIKAIFVYLQNEKKGCIDTCKIRVNGNFKYFDTCLIETDSVYVTSLGFNSKKEFNFYPKGFIIPDFGKVRFVKKKYSYSFSPVLYDKKKKVIFGQVKKEDGTKEYYSINVLGNEFYLSYAMEYYYTCNIFY